MSHCGKCGTDLLNSGGDALCPACLLEQGLTLSDLDSAGPNDVPPVGGPQIFGGYELLSEIARGGQGVVYRARHRQLNRTVALKMLALNPWATATHLKRFRTEAEAAANLDHPQIVPIYEVGQIGEQYYFTMKLIEGSSLKQLAATGLKSPRAAAEILVTVARAIHHAHEHGIVHRDIKPGNILLDDRGEPHVTDFGLAKLVEGESTLTNTMDVLGTPSYMSPEQAAGDAKDLTFATDVYGLGAVLYELLTGNPPFAGGTTLETLRQVIDKEPRKPSLWNPKVDRDLETICLKCLEKAPENRYASAAALADDLELWLGHAPIKARSIGPIRRLQKWSRRNPVRAMLLPIAGLLVALIAIAVSKDGKRPTNLAKRSLAVVIRPVDTSSAYLGRDLSRNLIHLLGRLSELTLVPRSQVLKWESSREPATLIARRLGVNHVLLGAIEQTNENFRLVFELLGANSGSNLWRREFHRPITELLQVPPQVTRNIISYLGIPLSAQDQHLMQRPITTNQAASLHYFAGMRFLTTLSETSVVDALREFQLATEADPQFAKAYSAQAEAQIALGYNFRNPALHFPEAKRLVNKALELDDTLPEAMINAGMVNYFLEWNWAEAEKMVAHALRIDPSIIEQSACFLHCLDTFGRADEAIEIVQRALEMQPSSMAVRLELPCAAYYAGQFERAELFGRDALKLYPDDPFLCYLLGRVLPQLKRYSEALEILWVGNHKAGGNSPMHLSEISYIYGMQGRTNEAETIIKQLQQREGKGEFIDPYLFAMIYAGLGNADQVFAHLTRACEVRSPSVPSVAVEPKFWPFAGDSRYSDLLDRLKLPAKRARTVRSAQAVFP